jgi:hypothetical protein
VLAQSERRGGGRLPPPSAAPSAAEGTGRCRQGRRPPKRREPYGLEALWKGSDAVAKTVLLLLLS